MEALRLVRRLPSNVGQIWRNPNRYYRQIERIRSLIEDAKKHNSRLREFSERINQNIGNLPQAYQRQISRDDQRLVLSAGNIEQHLNNCAASLTNVIDSRSREKSIDFYDTQTYIFQGSLYFVSLLEAIINAVRTLFKVEQQVADLLQVVEQESR